MLPKIDLPNFKIKMSMSDKELTLTPMTVKQHKNLLMARESGVQRDIFLALIEVLNDCVVETIDVSTLPLTEFGWLYIKLREISISNKEEFSISVGDETVPLKFNLTDVKIEYDAKKRENDLWIDVSKDTSIQLKEVPVSVYASKEYDTAATENDRWNILFAGAVDSIIHDDKTTSAKTIKNNELVEWLSVLPAKAFVDFQQVVNDGPKLEHVIKYKHKNPDTNEDDEQEFRLETLNDFFQL